MLIIGPIATSVYGRPPPLPGRQSSGSASGPTNSPLPLSWDKVGDVMGKKNKEKIDKLVDCTFRLLSYSFIETYTYIAGSKFIGTGNKFLGKFTR